MSFQTIARSFFFTLPYRTSLRHFDQNCTCLFLLFKICNIAPPLSPLFHPLKEQVIKQIVCFVFSSRSCFVLRFRVTVRSKYLRLSHHQSLTYRVKENSLCSFVRRVFLCNVSGKSSDMKLCNTPLGFTSKYFYNGKSFTFVSPPSRICLFRRCTQGLSFHSLD